MSFKKIIKSVQNKVDKGTKVLYVKYKNKKGTEINRAVDINRKEEKNQMDDEIYFIYKCNVNNNIIGG